MRTKYRRGTDVMDKIINKSLGLILLTMMAIVFVPQVSAAGLDTISIGGDSQVTIGNYATVYVNVTGASDVGSLQLDILFNPDVIIAQSIIPENLITGSSFAYNIDNTTGKITIGVINTNGINGDGPLAKINYSAIGLGESNIVISVTEMTDIVNNPITPGNIVNGAINIIEISDNVPPTINSVQLSNNNPFIGENINISADVTDNIGVSSVTADIYRVSNAAVNEGVVDSVELVNQENNIWSGTMTAKEGSYSVNVSARDDAGNVIWDNSTGYSALAQPVIAFEFGVDNSVLTIEEGVSADYTLTVKNIGDIPDTYTFDIYNPNSAIAELSRETVDVNPGQESTETLTVIGNVTGTYTVDVTATSKNDPALNKTVRTTTNVIPPVPRYIKEFGVGNGAIAGFIIGNVAVTNIDIVDHWFLVVVGGTDPIMGYPLVGTGTVYLSANESINVPILVSVPAGAIAGDYELYAGIYNYDNRIIAPEKLLEPIKGPVISTVS